MPSPFRMGAALSVAAAVTAACTSSSTAGRPAQSATQPVRPTVAARSARPAREGTQPAQPPGRDRGLPLRQIADVPLPGGVSRFDYQSIDPLAFDPSLRRLYVAAENGVVTVLGERERSLVTLGRAFLAPEAHTVAIDPLTHLVYFALQDVRGTPVLRIMAPTGCHGPR